jgi:hypothetical protein
VSAQVEGDRGEPRGASGAREVEMGLLAGSGAVQDQNAAPRRIVGLKERVGQTVSLAQLRGGLGGATAPATAAKGHAPDDRTPQAR